MFAQLAMKLLFLVTLISLVTSVPEPHFKKIDANGNLHVHLNLADLNKPKQAWETENTIRSQNRPGQDFGEDYADDMYKRNPQVHEESDIQRITMKDLAGDYSGNPGKKIMIDNVPITVQPKRTLLAKNFKLTKCGRSGCHSEKLTEREKRKFSKCNYEGSIDSDQGSKVNVAACNENGVYDIAIVSNKVKLKRNLYRVHPNGKVEISPNITINNHDEEEPEEKGLGPYVHNEMAGEDVLLDDKMYAVTIEDVDDNCCRTVKRKCHGDIHRPKCFQKEGKVVCNEGSLTCKKLKYIHSKKLQKQKQRRGNEYGHYNYEGYDTIEDGYDTIEDGYDTIEEEKNVRSQHVKYLKPSDLIKLVKRINKSQMKKGKNKKCLIKSPTRSKFTLVGCGRDRNVNEPCRLKEPIPKEKIYSERTVEFGVYVDMYVYKKMSDLLKTKNDEKITEKILQMVQSLLSQAEGYTTHESFTSLKGGFKFAVNGIQIYKELSDEASRDWDSSNTLRDLIDKFSYFAYEVNDACDAEANSFDAMVLFTGRSYSDTASGYAKTGALCDMKPAVVMIVEPNEQGDKNMVNGLLLAHELGHLFGSQHDGPQTVDGSACPENQHIMSPTVYPNMVSFSECTKKMIDQADKKRKMDKKDCLYT